MSDTFVKINTLSVSKNLADFVKNELLPGLDINEKDFWDGFDKSVNELAPIKKFDSYNFLVAKLAYKILSYSFEFKR
mgnify:CR=1 FL=1